MKPILEIHSISKKFSINHEQQPYLSLRDSISGMFKNKTSKEDFWALKEVSFNVMPGDTVGIIGKNGAGKSTLLKILSKITPPTSGKIVSRGRIASLLEVGTGFHPELSGRENIFMNGSILGMRKAEILKNFDEIVDFAGVEKFIDTPLKHYSSGMQLRLAFAVAAFLENEILIIDEVLAVGDAEFQKKCIGKMEDVSKNGKTLLFVSHDLSSVTTLTQKSILLESGKLSSYDSTEIIIKKYLESYGTNKQIRLKTGKDIFVSDFYLNSKKENYAVCNEKVVFVIEVQSKVTRKGIFVGIGVNDELGRRLFTPFSKHFNHEYVLKEGVNTFTCEIEKLPLKPAMYTVEIYIGDGYNAFEYYNDKLEFEVIASKTIPLQQIPVETQGFFMINQIWN